MVAVRLLVWWQSQYKGCTVEVLDTILMQRNCTKAARALLVEPLRMASNLHNEVTLLSHCPLSHHLSAHPPRCKLYGVAVRAWW